MSLELLAQYLGYGLMGVSALAVLALVLFVVSFACVRSVNKWIKAMVYAYDLNVLRRTMRQLEAEGKVSRKSKVAM